MTFTDYLTDTVLVLLVLRQIRESRLSRRALLLPLIIVAVVAQSYLHGIPTAGNDLILVATLTGVGAAIGLASGLVTRVRSDGGQYPLVKAGAAAAALWVLGMGSRFAFAIWANNGGGSAIGRFSAAHHITSGYAWTAALVLMALAEVVSRVAILYVRGQRAQAEYRPVQPRAFASV